MNNTKKNKTRVSFVGRHRFMLMVLMSVFITAVLVSVSMSMYNSSGAAQLDLSRPGYISVRDKAVKNDSDFQAYSNTGEINQKTISEFKALFIKQAVQVKSVDAFGGDPLSSDSLGFSAVDDINQ